MSRCKDRGELGWDLFDMETHPTDLRFGFQHEVHVNVKEEKRLPSPGIPRPRGGEGGGLGCIPENAGRSNQRHIFFKMGGTSRY